MQSGDNIKGIITFYRAGSLESRRCSNFSGLSESAARELKKVIETFEKRMFLRWPFSGFWATRAHFMSFLGCPQASQTPRFPFSLVRWEEKPFCNFCGVSEPTRPRVGKWTQPACLKSLNILPAHTLHVQPMFSFSPWRKKHRHICKCIDLSYNSSHHV